MSGVEASKDKSRAVMTSSGNVSVDMNKWEERLESVGEQDQEWWQPDGNHYPVCILSRRQISPALSFVPSITLLSSFVGQSFNANEETIKSSTL